MKPLAETIEAVEEFGPFADHDLLAELDAAALRVTAVVPDCVGLSLAVLDEDVTLTLAATRGEVAVLDAAQYVTDGPCLEAVRAEQVVSVDHDDMLSEPGWHLFARATAAEGIASTLTLPIFTQGRVSGSINLYAATPTAFHGHHEAMAEIFGAWAPGAVADADLSFSTRAEAEAAPQRKRDELQVVRAVAMLAVLERIDTDAARARLRDAVARTGVPEPELAELIITSLEGPDDEADQG